MVLTWPPFFWPRLIYILYLDDAGSVANPRKRYFVLAGIAIFERQIHWLAQGMERWPPLPDT